MVMAIIYGKDQRTTSAGLKVTVAALCGILTLPIVGMLLPLSLAPLIAFDVAALVFVLWTWLTIWPLGSKLTAQHAVRDDPSRSTSDLLVLLASMASLVAVGLVLFKAGSSVDATRIWLVVLGIISVILSWIVVHTLFSLRYAELYYHEPIGGIDFNGDNNPTYKDFAYVAFTLGMTFQVSDTAITNQKIRSTILRHALISYLFGTVIVATTINLIAGLIR